MNERSVVTIVPGVLMTIDPVVAAINLAAGHRLVLSTVLDIEGLWHLYSKTLLHIRFGSSLQSHTYYTKTIN